MKNIEFTKGNWEEHFKYAYSDRFDIEPEFVQEEDCIANRRNEKMRDGFEYTTIMLKDMYGAGTKMWFTSSFESYGAPLFTITDKIRVDKDGKWRYGPCHEVVIWEKGINVWDMYMVDGKLTWHRVMSLEFPLEINKKHELYVELKDKYIRFGVGDKIAEVRMDSMAEKVYVGVTGCENINRLYSLKIETE